MSRLALTVNGAAVTAEIEPRLHLADFLRDHLLLTGTHLGCEHGVCGACTLLIDGEPARACIAFAAECTGRAVTSIEGLENDPVITALRTAFSAEHALQCGYCTPGMLVTARDIVLRLPGADEDRIRLELAGNLCRCTGYFGIVRAIQRVLRDPPARETIRSEPVPAAVFAAATPVAGGPATETVAATAPGSATLEQRLTLAVPRDAVWAALRDPALVAACVPGAAITAIDGDRITGMLEAGLGPIRARFTGTGTIAYDDARHAGVLTGEGSDATTGTRLQGRAAFHVEAIDAAKTELVLNIAYGLRGALAQFARGPLVRALANEIAGQVARNLEARLRGETARPIAQPGIATLMLRAIRHWLSALFRR
jgi:carbon-monoxide dehydrogenase small subunit